MTGPEHYREAEQLVLRAHHYTCGDLDDPATGAAFAAEAQVHATLALTAATAALFDLTGQASGQTADEWTAALR